MENASKKTRVFARAALVAAAVIWGSSFLMMKNTIEVIPVHWLLFFRFLIGTCVMALALFKRLKTLDKDIIRHGAILGVLLFSFYSVQTIGVSAPILGAQATTAGKSAFLTGLYCVLTPFVMWVVYKNRPGIYNIIAALLCVTGIGFVVLAGGRGGVLLGDVLTLVNAAITALYIVLASEFSQKRDVMLMTMVQFATAGLIALAVALMFEPFPANIPKQAFGSIAYLGIFCTAVALGCQNFGQKYSPASGAALLLSLEAPFGVLFASLLGGGEEQITLQLGIGFILIFAAIIISETRLQFIPAIKQKQTEADEKKG